MCGRLKYLLVILLGLSQSSVKGSPLSSFRCTIYDLSGRFPRLPQIRDVNASQEAVAYRFAAEDYSLNLKINRWGILATVNYQDQMLFDTSSAIEMRLHHVNPRFRLWCLKKIP